MSDEYGVMLADPPVSEEFNFDATDVTGTQHLTARGVDRRLPAGEVAKALASRMSLPSSVPWTLLRDGEGTFVEDDRPIGDQLIPGESVTILPKTHLG